MISYYFALGNEPIEEHLKTQQVFLERQMNDNVSFVGSTSYREGILTSITSLKPSVLMVMEGLPGETPWTDLLYQIRMKSPNTRIIFLAGMREPGDKFLYTLTQLGIYDILLGGQTSVKQMVRLMIMPQTIKDVAYLIPKIHMDDNSQETIFESPDLELIQETMPPPTPAPTPPPAPAPTPKPIPIQKEPEQPKDNKRSFSIPKPNIPKPSIPKISFPTTNKEKVETEPITETRKERRKDKKQITLTNFNQQIVTFLGMQGGTGNTQLAFNTALAAAESGAKVLYMDCNQNYSSIDALYMLGYEDVGLDTLLEKTKEDAFDEFEVSIGNGTKLKACLDKKDSMYRLVKRLPVSFDFVFFSQECLNEHKKIDYSAETFKDLILFLFCNYQYDLIVLDAPSDTHNPLTEMALIYSNQVFLSMVQDYSVIRYYLKERSYYQDKGIPLAQKSHIILNKYENSGPTPQKLSKQLDVPLNRFITFPANGKEFMQAMMAYTPYLWFTNNNEWKLGMQEILLRLSKKHS